MTEERRKELAKEWQMGESIWTLEELENLIKEVAAEVREEVIEEAAIAIDRLKEQR